jgi:hypothetical protein
LFLHKKADTNKLAEMLLEMFVMEEFEYSGIWWLPENPDNKISGILKFHPVEDANLELNGSFKGPKDLNSFLQPNIILGITSNGKIITLYKCYESHFHISVPGFFCSSFIASVVFQGYHFEKEEDIIFNSLSLNYSHLEEWMRITGFNFKLETDLKNHLTKHEVSYSFPQKVEAKVDKINISFDYDFTSSGDRIKEVNLKQTTFIKIEPHKPIHFNDYRRSMCYHIQNFLCLAIGRAVYPLIIKGKNKACKTNLSDGRIVYNDIFIFYSIKGLSDLSKKIHPFDMLFSFGDISDDFEKYLRNWLAKSEILQPVYDLYFGTLYNSSMYLQHEFLSLIQAIESYHRRIYNGEYLLNDDYTQIYQALIKAIPQEIDNNFKESLKQKLKYHNEFSLRKRLKEILEKCGDAVNLLIHKNEIFIEDVVNTRNFLTHYDKGIEVKAKKDQELYGLVQKMKFTLEICFLIELEIPEETVKSLVSRNQRYQYLAKK